jgi:site-specific DNA-cytosine methylase
LDRTELLPAGQVPALDMTLRVLELFCGVGGYHLALKQLLSEAKLRVTPVDNNLTAINTYAENFALRYFLGHRVKT